MSSVTTTEKSIFLPRCNARLVGYGTLKILKDTEITSFKNAYLKWLKDENAYPNQKVFYHGGVNFLDYLKTSNNTYYRRVFWDENLKESKCKYYNKPVDNIVYSSCQAWGGNSGGLLFDDDNRLMGIITRVHYAVGDDVYAGMAGSVGLRKK